MKTGITIVAGLLVGVLVAGGILAAFVLVGPEPVGLRPKPSPTIIPTASVAPSASPIVACASAAPGSSVAPGGSATPSGSVTPSGTVRPSAAVPSASTGFVAPGGSTAPSASAAPSGSTAPSAPTTSSAPGSSVACIPSPSASPAPNLGSADLGAAFHIGQPAPALEVTQVGGGTIDLADLRGKPVWLNFMQTTCPECVDEFPLMNGFATRYASTGLVVMAIDIREDEGVVAAFADRLKAEFPLELDIDGKAQQAWGTYALPIHFWIDKDGIVRAGALGGAGRDALAAGLQKILPGVTVTP